jgi:IS4 transposase
MKKLLLKSSKYIEGKIRVMCDREFCTVPYIKVLEELNADYLMAITKNSRINRIIKETKEFPRVVRYLMGRGDNKVEFWLIMVKNEKGDVHTFATNIEVTEGNCEELVELYRNRWTIETSYRMMHDVRARTCSKNFAFRWFLVLFGLLVRNGYYLFNEIIIYYGHITLKTFAELTSEARLKDFSKLNNEIVVSNRNGGDG